MPGSEYNINEISELFQVGRDETPRVICAGVFETSKARGRMTAAEEDFRYSMEELAALTKACGLEPAGQVTQSLERAGHSCYMGTGKLEEIRELAAEVKAEAVIFNDSLSPAQFRNLQKVLGLPILDRTALILEIFRSRARSRESMLQVEYARLSYIRTRLVGMWDTLGRKGGASGAQSSRGEGETQLELDRRSIDQRLSRLRKELKEVSGERETRRRRRTRSRLPLVSLVGYTNAGKSTIMNALLDRYGAALEGAGTSAGGSVDRDKKVFEANMLFATLDSSVRRISPGSTGDFLLSDTVGFIHKLPTSLVEAFQSTLEEASEADLLILVADVSDSHYPGHLKVTEEILSELGAGGIPRIIVYNKSDLCDPQPDYPRVVTAHRGDGREGRPGKSIYLSAKDPASIDLLVGLITEELFGSLEEMELLLPYTRGRLAAELREHAEILSEEYTAEGTLLKVRGTKEVLGRFLAYKTADQ